MSLEALELAVVQGSSASVRSVTCNCRLKHWLVERDVMIGAWLTREVTRVPDRGDPFHSDQFLLSCVFVSQSSSLGIA